MVQNTKWDTIIYEVALHCIPFEFMISQNIYFYKLKLFGMVLIFCVELWELSHVTRDLFQAEKKINFDTS